MIGRLRRNFHQKEKAGRVSGPAFEMLPVG